MLVKLALPADPCVDLATAKAHLRVDGSAEDTLIQAYLDAAIATVETHTTLALAATTFEERFDCWPSSGRFALGTAPVRDVTEIAYRDADGNEQLLDGADWYWRPTTEGADVVLVSGFSAPALWGRDDDVMIRFEAGSEPAGGSPEPEPRLVTPSQAISCVLLLVANWFRWREPVQSVAQNPLPLGVDALLAQLRIYR